MISKSVGHENGDKAFFIFNNKIENYRAISLKIGTKRSASSVSSYVRLKVTSSSNISFHMS